MEQLKEKLRGYYFAPDYSGDFCYHAIRIRKYVLVFRLQQVSAGEEYTFEHRGHYYHLQLLENRDSLPEEKIQSEMRKVKEGFKSFSYLKHQFHKQKNSTDESR